MRMVGFVPPCIYFPGKKGTLDFQAHTPTLQGSQAVKSLTPSLG